MNAHPSPLSGGGRGNSAPPPGASARPQRPGCGWLPAFLAAGLLAGAASAPAADGLAPLPLKLPAPTIKGTPPDQPLKGPHIEPLDLNKVRAPFLAPAGARNLALNKTATCSDPKPRNGEPALVIDGSKEPMDDDVLELHKGVQYVQVDLGAPCVIHAVVLWLDHRYYQIIHDVVVQTAEDAAFTKNVRTLFNNDRDNSAKLGEGADKEYFETNQGRLVDAKGVQARYVRCYSQGSSESGLNCYTEIEVWGLPGQ